MPAFGRYSLVRRIGVGGMAEIWKAKVLGPAGFEKILAIKKVLPELAEDSAFIEMFVEEAKLVATLVHPNIVQVFDFGRVGNDWFIAMEYVAGTNLARLQQRAREGNSRIPPEVAIYLTIEALKGLGHAHARTDASGVSLGIVHRDVSPQNLLVSFSGEVKVTDFGIAKVSTTISRTSEGQIRGKLAYMSPEQASGQVLDGRSDLFSLTLVLFELLTGKRYFSGASAPELYTKVATHPGLGAVDMAILPPALVPLMTRALLPKRDDRYANAKEFEAALTDAVGADGLLLARDLLGKAMGTLFAVEHRAEAVPEPADAPLAAGGGEAGLEAATDTVVSDPARKPTSGITLNPQPEVRALAPKAPWDPSQQIARPTPAKSRAGIVGAAIMLLVLVAAAGSRALGLWPAAPTPTPIALATPALSPRVTSTPVATPTMTSAATASRPTPAARAIATKIARATPVPVVEARPGYLFVTARPWVAVFVDGKRVAKETPVRQLIIPAGPHTLRFENDSFKFSAEKKIDVASGANVTLFVDVTSKSIELE